MNTELRDHRLRLTSRFQLLAAMLVLCGVGQSAFGQAATWRIGENATVVQAAIALERNEISQEEFDDILMDATCQNPYARLQDRNRPFLAIVNDSDDDEITSATINMEEAGFVFGDGDMAGDGFNGLLTMLSSASDDGVEIVSSSFGADMTELNLMFSGLTAGQAAIFRVDIDEPNGVYMFPDYREAFQGANEGFGRNGDVALLTANFQSGATSNAMFPQFGRLSTAGQVEGYHTQTMTPPETSMVPEPTSMCLVLAGLTGLCTVRRRR